MNDLSSFKSKAFDTHGTAYDYSNFIYKNVDHKSELTCNTCGDVFYMSPYKHINRKQGCKVCSVLRAAAKRKAKAASKFLDRARAKHGDKFDYSLVTYNGKNSKVDIICPIHGIFRQTPDGHYVSGCNRCGIEATQLKQSGTLDKFKCNIKVKFGDVYNYRLSVYTTAKAPIIVECTTCGDEIHSTPDNLQSRANYCSCQTKYSGGFKKYLPAILYYLRVDYLGKVAYKIGITNRSVMERFKRNNKGDITIIAEWKYSNGIEALNSETKIKQDFKVYKWDDIPMLRDGNSELFDRDILEMDNG